MPLPANFSLQVVKEELGRIGIHLLEDFKDGQTRWGTEPLIDGHPYSGSSSMASECKPDRYDIYTIRAIITRLDMAGHLPQFEERLFPRIHE